MSPVADGSVQDRHSGNVAHLEPLPLHVALQEHPFTYTRVTQLLYRWSVHLLNATFKHFQLLKYSNFNHSTLCVERLLSHCRRSIFTQLLTASFYGWSVHLLNAIFKHSQSLKYSNFNHSTLCVERLAKSLTHSVTASWSLATRTHIFTHKKHTQAIFKGMYLISNKNNVHNILLIIRGRNNSS